MDVHDLSAYMAHVGAAARSASTRMAAASTAAKNDALLALARLLRDNGPALAQANARDLAAAESAGLSGPMLDRLKLGDKVIATVAEGCEQIAAMPDPIGEILNLRRRPSGIGVGQMRVPLGVFGMIYESRPNVTIEAASLAIKSGNAAILRGGSESFHSSRAIHACMVAGLKAADLPEGSPLDAAFTPEGAEYVEHFCGLECYQRFEARAETGNETDADPNACDSLPSD